jgi:CheY-like chemotaxis protein/anti-sigma regulatory factor (Ser/Thr protein kinase)
MVRPSAETRDVALHVLVNDVLSVRGDASRLKQVFWNLLSNAIKFTPAGGTIDVELRHSDGNAEVIVRDTGEGIDPKFLPHVFARFRQADASTTRKYGGLGIGLSVVASLVAAHDGTVRAESEGLGRGATFTVTIPLIEQNTIQMSRGTASKFVDMAPPYPGIAPQIVPRGDSRSVSGATTLAGARILIVDDDAGARKVMLNVLSAAGAEVRECSNALEAFETVSQWQPNILVSDLAMPNEDGYTLIRRIRDSGNLMAAVAITAYVRPEDEARVREAGFQRHVAKPFDPEDLVQAVRDLRL